MYLLPMTIARGTFTVTGGDEQTIRGADGGPRLTRINGSQRFEGAIVGDGAVDWLMRYASDGSARFAGFQRIAGAIGGRSGSFELESTGFHDGRSSSGNWRIVPGSGTGDLEGISGYGTFEAPGGPMAAYTLDYEIG